MTPREQAEALLAKATTSADRQVLAEAAQGYAVLALADSVDHLVDELLKEVRS